MSDIWVFVDENGGLLGFNSFIKAKKYAYEIYDKELKFSEKLNGIYCYVNSCNSEDVYITKLKMHCVNATNSVTEDKDGD